MKDFVFPTTEYYDGNYWKYQPGHVHANSLPSSWLLKQSFNAHQCVPFYYNVTRDIQEELGVNRSVWGYKMDAKGDPMWEFYFYYYKKYPKHSFRYLCEHIFSRTNVAVPTADVPGDYFLVSTDLDPAKVNDLTMYYPDVFEANDRVIPIQDTGHSFSGSHPNSLSYKIHGSDPSLVPYNVYYSFADFPIPFFSAWQMLRRVAHEVFPGTDPELFLEYTRLPFLNFNNQTYVPICVARKKDAIGLYFTNLRLYDLIGFLKYFAFPPEFVRSVIDRQEDLSHLQNDIGLDLVVENGKLAFKKAAIFGSF